MNSEIKQRIKQIKNGEIPDGYRSTKAGVLPKWDCVRLNQIAEPITKIVGNGTYETLSISAGIGFVNQAKKFGKELSGKQYEKYTVLNRGDFSYNKGNSKSYPQGCIYRLKDRETAAVPNVFESFKIKKDSPDYYEQLFTSGYLNKQLSKKINHGVRDNGLLNLTEKDFYSCYVPHPPIAEQQKIAEILMQCDKVIELKQKRIEEEKKLKKALMQKLLNPDSGIRLPGFKCEWKKTCIGDITELYSGGTPKSSEIENYADESGIPFIRSGEISSTYTELFLSEIGYKNSSAKMVKKGDLLYALYGANSGDCFISKMDGAINQAILCIKSKSEDIRYIYYVLSNSREKITSIYLQGGQGNLSATIIKKLKIDLPSPEEQRAIVSALNSKDTIIENLEKELEQWQHKKKSLMQLLLTGIVRVK